MTDDESPTIESDPDEFKEGVKAAIEQLREDDDIPDIIDEEALFGFAAEVAQEFEERNGEDGE